MKVCLVVHGYPPELVGGTENSVQNVARGLARRGIDVVVVAGSMQHEQGFRTSTDVDRHPSGEGGEIRVHRIHRADLYFDHWQKSASARVAEAFRALLRKERPDVVHVHHWLRLTRDLVHCAALEGIPAAVTLHDLWTSCLVTFRVRPDTRAYCDVPLATDPCLDCAALVPPKTPWVAREDLFFAFHERKGDLVRELELARAVLVPSRAHAERLEGYLGVAADALALRVVPHGRDLAVGERDEAPVGDPGKLVLGAWGHLHPLKGQDLILEAIGLLSAPERVELHLAGDEPDAEYAAKLDAASRGLNVVRHGAFEVDELDRHPVGAVHAMVSGTRAHESWGLVLDEALALRLPMVLPRSGAYAERLSEDAGVLFYEQANARSLAEVLQRLLDEPGLAARLRADLPPLADVCPSVEKHVEQLLEVYEAVRAAGSPETAATEAWWEARMRIAREEAWDASLSRCNAEELGFS